MLVSQQQPHRTPHPLPVAVCLSVAFSRRCSTTDQTLESSWSLGVIDTQGSGRHGPFRLRLPATLIWGAAIFSCHEKSRCWPQLHVLSCLPQQTDRLVHPAAPSFAIYRFQEAEHEQTDLTHDSNSSQRRTAHVG